jgi:type I restriction enzyme M protein
MQTDELEHKLQLKRLGGEEFKAENQRLPTQVDSQLAALDENKKEEKKKMTALQKDLTALQARIARTDAMLTSIGGQLTAADAKTLILKKLYDLAIQQLNRYLNAEKRQLVRAVEGLWDKYAVSSHSLESRRTDTLKALDEVLSVLGYSG